MFKWMETKLFHTIADCIFDGFIIVNKEGIVQLINRGAEKLLSIDKATAIGQKINVIYPDTKLYSIIESGRLELNQTEYINHTRLIVNRIPLQDSEGEKMGAVAVFRSFSDTEDLDNEISSLIETRTLLHAIINSSHDAISVVNEKGLGTLINPAYTRLTGLSEKDVINKVATVDIPDGRESMHLKVLTTRKPVNNVRMKLGPNNKDVIVDVAPIFIDNVLKGSVGVVHDVSEIKKLTKELADVRRIIHMQQNAKYSFNDIIGSGVAIKYAIDQAQRAALTPATVLLRGESGTGKELFAHAIHNASDRKNCKFIKVNCAALTETLLESELFGYIEGAFTGARRGGKIGFFEEAHNGTLFLDEIGELSFNLQSKLLRVLQEKEIVKVGDTNAIPVDVRLVVATNANLEKLIENEKFREDLYYRINMFQIIIPPLRHRKEDIPQLCCFISNKLTQEFGRSSIPISEPALKNLQEYTWPGNVRELENILGRAIINMKPTDTVIEVSHLSGVLDIKIPHSVKEICAEPMDELRGTYAEYFDKWENQLLTQALLICNGNKTKVAKTLNLSIRGLYYKLQKYDIK